MAARDVTINVPDGEIYDTVVVIVPMPKGLIKGAETKQALQDRLVATANDAVTQFVTENGINWAGPDRKARWV